MGNVGKWVSWLILKIEMGPICQKRCQVVKKMSSCQKDVNCQKVKHMDYGGGSQKKIN